MKFYNGLLVIVCALSFFACKEKTFGCSDPESPEYMGEVEIDDGSCTHSGELSFWYNDLCRDSLLANDIQIVVPEITSQNSIVINTQTVSWSAEPICALNETRLTAELGTTFGKWINFKVKGLNSNSVEVRTWEDSMYVSANSCYRYKIIW